MDHRVGAVQALTVALLLVSQPLRSQEPTISVDVKVVNVLAAVRDKHGQVVRNLTRDDFTLEEDGRPQTIRYFSQERARPGWSVNAFNARRSIHLVLVAPDSSAW